MDIKRGSINSRSVTIIIAASDSTVKNKLCADYVCTGEKDEIVINLALTAGAGGKIVFLDGNYSVRNPILPPNNTEIEIIGTITRENAVTSLLTANAALDQPDVTVADASLFSVGDWVACYDSDSPTQGGKTGQTRKVASSGTILSITGNTIQLSGDLDYALTVASGAILGTIGSIVLIEGKTGVYIHGSGILDGDKDNQFDCNPAAIESSGEEIRAGCCVSIKTATNTIIDSLVLQNAVLHNVVSMSCTSTNIRNTLCQASHDKNILCWIDTNFKATNNICKDSLFEDGIIAYASNVGAVLQGNYCEGNNRYGISTGVNDRQCITIGNILKDNNDRNINYRASGSSSIGDLSLSLTAVGYGAMVSATDMTITGLNVYSVPDGYGCLLITGSYIRIYGGLLRAFKTGTGLARGLLFGSGGDVTASNVIVRDMVIRECKTGIFADSGITNCKVDNWYPVDNDTDLSDSSAGGLVIT